MRILQLQNLVKQNGRRGTPPHVQHRGNDDRYLNQSQKSNLTPRDSLNQSNSNLQMDQSPSDVKNSNLKSNYLHSHSNGDLFYVPEKEKPSNIQRCPSYQENYPQKTVTFSTNFPKAKSGPGIQMGLSSISNHSHNNSRSKPHRQHSFDTYPNYKPPPSYSNCDNNRINSHYHPPHPGRRLDETFESVTTNAYDDDDNTTTSGSYTIDNNTNDDFVELKVEQLKDIFVWKKWKSDMKMNGCNIREVTLWASMCLYYSYSPYMRLLSNMLHCIDVYHKSTFSTMCSFTNYMTLIWIFKILVSLSFNQCNFDKTSFSLKRNKFS